MADMMMEKKVVMVAVDDSQESHYALQKSIDSKLLQSNSNCNGCSVVHVILLHVQPLPLQVLVGPGVGPGRSPGGLYLTSQLVDSVSKHQDEITKKVLLHAKSLCEEHKLEVETMVAIGDPREAICDAVEQLQPDFLIMGSHGYSTIKRVFLGSVSDYCAHNARCPVIIIKKP